MSVAMPEDILLSNLVRVAARTTNTAATRTQTASTRDRVATAGESDVPCGVAWEAGRRNSQRSFARRCHIPYMLHTPACDGNKSFVFARRQQARLEWGTGLKPLLHIAEYDLQNTVELPQPWLGVGRELGHVAKRQCARLRTKRSWVRVLTCHRSCAFGRRQQARLEWGTGLKPLLQMAKYDLPNTVELPPNHG
ncbi:hypothetical protein Bbelb_041300 [Branchiostoma belcheri]|nr:hypothetical protein Bbelb_041300 [Branchiostoma belcheri]